MEPLLFTLFINNLPDVCANCKLHLSADDFCFYISDSIEKAGLMFTRANGISDAVAHWSAINGIRINARKTQAIWFGTSGFYKKVIAWNPLRIVFEVQVIESCQSLKLLGFTLDSTLTWKQHCALTSRKCYATLSRLRKGGYFLARSTKLTLIK